jgi:hypothetical protein
MMRLAESTTPSPAQDFRHLPRRSPRNLRRPNDFPLLASQNDYQALTEHFWRNMKGFVSRIVLLITLLGSVSPAFSEAVFRTQSLPTDNATVGGQRLDLTKINARLARHDASVLSIIPANGYKDGLAGVFRDYHLRRQQRQIVLPHHLDLTIT